jgi:hypothetical protein
LLTKKAMALLGISRRRASSELLDLGFQRVEFSTTAGATWITLHKALKGNPTTLFNAASGNIAAVRPANSSSSGSPELTVFDTGRDRIGATRIPSPRSLDDPDSPLSRLAALAPGILKLSARAAHVPQIGGLMAAAFPQVTEQARRWHGTAAAENIRIANLNAYVSGGETCFIRTGRNDREFDPPPWTDGVTHAQRWQYVIDMMHTVTGDLGAAWRVFVTTPEMTALSQAQQILTGRVVEVAWAHLWDRSLEAFRSGMMWPLALRLIGLDDGAAQYVRHVAEGREP